MDREEFYEKLDSTVDWMETEVVVFRYLWEEREWEFLRKAEQVGVDFDELWNETYKALYQTYDEANVV